MSGLLSKAICNGTNLEIATVPTDNVRYSLVNILLVNTTGDEVQAKIYATTQSAPTEVDLLEHRVVLAANGGRVEYSCGCMSPGEKIFVNAPQGVVCRVTSVDEDQ